MLCGRPWLLPPGDVLVVLRLIRLGRSLRELIDLGEELKGRSVGFRNLKKSRNAMTAGSKLFFYIFPGGVRAGDQPREDDSWARVRAGGRPS